VTTVRSLDVAREVAAITAMLVSRRDPSYEAGMRRTVPSQQPAHSVRVPQIYKTAAEWRREHKDASLEEVFELCDALWAIGWREERRVAIEFVLRSQPAMAAIEWNRLEGWSADIDNWELVDHLSDVTGRLLIERPELIERVRRLEESESPWQRRLVLVTLIIAFMKSQDGWLRPELEAMAERLRKDPHPLVRRAVVWARDRLAKDHLDG
jgi:3-methyladenine DNA glycosylase AlkD